MGLFLRRFFGKLQPVMNDDEVPGATGAAIAGR